MLDGFPLTNETEDALYKSMGRFSVQFYILQNANKCSIIILPTHRTETSQFVDNCKNMVYHLRKCGVFEKVCVGGVT